MRTARASWLHVGDQPTIDILQEPYQDLKALTKDAFARNRTASAEGARKEHEHLFEIDKYATKGGVEKLQRTTSSCSTPPAADRCGHGKLVFGPCKPKLSFADCAVRKRRRPNI